MHVLLFAALLAPPDPAAVEKARQAAAQLGAQIRAVLMQELKNGGFPGAVAACAASAQKTTAEFARAQGIEIRRVSLKYRNAADAPDAYEESKLRSLAHAASLPEELAEVRTESGRPVLRYLKPITIGAMCLTCHGPADRMNAEVRAQIEKHYPQDRATGYREGELRGAFTVRIPLDQR
jgi:hypothetical protein